LSRTAHPRFDRKIPAEGGLIFFAVDAAIETSRSSAKSVYRRSMSDYARRTEPATAAHKRAGWLNSCRTNQRLFSVARPAMVSLSLNPSYRTDLFHGIALRVLKAVTCRRFCLGRRKGSKLFGGLSTVLPSSRLERRNRCVTLSFSRVARPQMCFVTIIL